MVEQADARLSGALFASQRDRSAIGPTVGVVIPFWQREPALLRAAVESVCAQQTDVGVEIVVVDDGSPVSARDELHGLAPGPNFSIRLIERANAGVAAARNAALDAVADRVEYVAFLDSDDIWDPNHLSRMLAAFTQGADFYFTDYRRPDEATSSFQQNSNGRLSADAPLSDLESVYWLQNQFLDIIIKNSPIGLSTIGYRAANARAIRFSNEFRRACEDRYFLAELSQYIDRVAFCSCQGAIYGVGANLFKAARFGSLSGAERIRDSARFHARVAARFPLDVAQKSWNDLALVSLDHQFIETACSYIASEKALCFGVIKSYVTIRPAVVWRVLPDLLYILWRKLRKIARKERKCTS